VAAGDKNSESGCKRKVIWVFIASALKGANGFKIDFGERYFCGGSAK